MTGAVLALSLLLTTSALDKVDVVDTLNASVISVSKTNSLLDKASSPVVSIYRADAERRNLANPRSVSTLVPNLHIPQYGSAMTSSIYVRGFGSRMENPSIALYVDEIPVLDKNMFDTDFLDIRRVDFASGPQATLLGVTPWWA